jgi:DnaJ-domain-containing protein 1
MPPDVPTPSLPEAWAVEGATELLAAYGTLKDPLARAALLRIALDVVHASEAEAGARIDGEAETPP